MVFSVWMKTLFYYEWVSPAYVGVCITLSEVGGCGHIKKEGHCPSFLGKPFLLIFYGGTGVMKQVQAPRLSH